MTNVRAPDASAPWVIVAGSFHDHGGMDKANAALARHLLDRGSEVHLVAHSVTDDLARRPNACVHLAAHPAGSFLLGESVLHRLGRRIAREVTTRAPATRVVANGSNCNWPGLNWVHYVHHAANRYDASAPAWFRVKHRITSARARAGERRALGRARTLVANSERTRDDLVTRLGIEPERVRVVYLGSDPTWMPASEPEIAAARTWLGATPGRPVVVFVGAMGYDERKGFDTLWAAWRALCATPDWDADLWVAGGGRGLPRWVERTARAGLSHRIRFLGFTQRVRDLLAAADLLVSPVRYEPYGLNVQEAICRGVPAVVSRVAGAAERYGPLQEGLLLASSDDVAGLVRTLRSWRSEMTAWKQRFAPLSAALRTHTWEAMAAEIEALGGLSSPAPH
ncbi:hypothetical protein tb265_15650 [Gemmatimonadetes bacterium T265]|nr:hypothetical protein tb265_15650 [Gemmatimonadetes bacterium T265]